MEITINTFTELLTHNQALRDEALAWHKRVADLQTDLNIEREKNRVLAIENVKLLNMPNKAKVRQYANTINPVSNNESVSNNE
jgi:hypothetical protein